MLRTFVIALLALAVVAGTAAAQTTTPAPSPNQGAFDNLSPGNQKIVDALCNAQQGGCPTSSGGTTLTKDQIAVMKQHKGFGVIFKDMQKNGQIPPDVKNLGQLVSGRYQSQSGTSTTITSASGRSQVVGKPEHGNKSGKGHLDNDGAGSSYGRGSESSGPGRGYGYGHGDNSGSSAGGMGRSGVSSQGGGRGK